MQPWTKYRVYSLFRHFHFNASCIRQTLSKQKCAKPNLLARAIIKIYLKLYFSEHFPSHICGLNPTNLTSLSFRNGFKKPSKTKKPPKTEQGNSYQLITSIGALLHYNCCSQLQAKSMTASNADSVFALSFLIRNSSIYFAVPNLPNSS